MQGYLAHKNQLVETRVRGSDPHGASGDGFEQASVAPCGLSCRTPTSERKRERERERNRERERERERTRERARERNRDSASEREKQREREIEREIKKERESGRKRERESPVFHRNGTLEMP